MRRHTSEARHERTCRLCNSAIATEICSLSSLISHDDLHNTHSHPFKQQPRQLLAHPFADQLSVIEALCCLLEVCMQHVLFNNQSVLHGSEELNSCPLNTEQWPLACLSHWVPGLIIHVVGAPMGAPRHPRRPAHLTQICIDTLPDKTCIVGGLVTHTAHCTANAERRPRASYLPAGFCK